MSQQVNPKITISGFDIEWDLERGINLWANTPTLSMWIPNTVAGMMAGFFRMVGEERFNLCMQLGGQNSVDGDWAVISSCASFEAGMARMSEIAWPAGWGRWTVVSVDHEKKQAVYRVFNNWEALYQRALGVCWGSGMIAGKLAGITSRLFGVGCWAAQTAFSARNDPYDEFVVTESKLTSEERLEKLVVEGKASSTDLAIALERLKVEVDARERTAAELREKLALIDRQEEALRSLAVPIISVWDGVLTVPFMGSLDEQRAALMTERLLEEIVRSRSRFAILDLTAIEVIDTSTADHLVRIMRAIALLGARAVITGIRPAVAKTMVSIGVDLSSLMTLRDLQEGLKMCMRLIAEEKTAAEERSAK